MLVLRRRLAIAGIITAAAIAVPAAALAASPGPPSGKPAPPSASAIGGGKSAPAPSAANSGPASSQVKQAGPDLPPAPVAEFATRLGVGTSAAGRAFKQIAVLSSNGGVDPASAAFAAIAHELGVSPAQLAAAWDAANQSGPDN
jgi:hypothetical protein